MEVDSNGIVKATGNLDIFKKKAEEVRKTASDTEKSTASLDSVFKSLSPSALSAVAGITALVGAFKGMVSASKQMMEITSHFEQTEKGLETVLQSASKGQMLFEDLRKFSFSTTFGIDELASASTQLLNVGVSQNNLKNQLKMLGDLAQGDKTKFAELTSIVAKIESTGKAGAMQLNQLALRGIPIKKTLEEMGVTGMATADQINQAFEKMTGAGGQFHNAMENIIDTIEGKRGFISDTMKEIAVNFGEVSGITDAYKKSLDVLYSILNGVNNALRSINENPLIKAIIQGTLTTSITLLVGVIGVGMVLALKKVIGHLSTVITQLGIIQALSGVVGWITLAVGAIAGVGVGIASYIKSVKEADESTKDWGTTVSTFVVQNGEYVKVLDEVEHKVKSINDIYNEMSENGTTNDYIESIKKRMDYIKKEMASFESGDYTTLSSEGKSYQQLSDELKEAERLFENQIIAQRTLEAVQAGLLKQENIRNKQIEEQNKLYQEQLATVESIYKKTQNGQLEELEKSISSYEKVLTQNGFYNYETKNGRTTLTHTKLTDEERKYFQTALDELKDQKKKILDEMKLKSLLEEDGGWRKIMQDALGLSDQDVLDGALNNGGNAIKQYIKDIETRNERISKTNQAIGINNGKSQASVIAEEIKTIMDTYNSLLSTGKFGVKDDGTLDNTTIAVNEALNRLKDDFISAGGTVEQFNELIGNVNAQGKKQSYFLNGLKGVGASVTAGSDIGVFASSLKENNGNVKNALIDAFMSSLTKLIGGLNGLDMILNPINDILESFAPLLKSIMLVVYVLLTPFRWIAEWLGKLMQKLFGEWADTWDSLTNEQKTQAEQLKAINEQYKNLLVSMKEQEEYYLAQKKIINAESYANGVYNVNDMILTPQGNFSTHPDDYLIATKNPASLGGTKTLQPIINDYGGNDIEVQSRITGDGMEELIINISKKVADDYANGRNGWNGAYQMKQSKLNGRSVQ